jgi:hypothetical protein
MKKNPMVSRTCILWQLLNRYKFYRPKLSFVSQIITFSAFFFFLRVHILTVFIIPCWELRGALVWRKILRNRCKTFCLETGRTVDQHGVDLMRRVLYSSFFNRKKIGKCMSAVTNIMTLSVSSFLYTYSWLYHKYKYRLYFSSRLLQSQTNCEPCLIVCRSG